MYKLQIDRWIDIVMTIFIRGKFHKYIFIHVVGVSLCHQIYPLVVILPLCSILSLKFKFHPCS
jgi:hypothetical protein